MYNGIMDVRICQCLTGTFQKDATTQKKPKGGDNKH